MLQLREPVRQREHGAAILPDDGGGDALQRHVLGVKVGEQPAVGVAVHVNESRRERQAMDIADLLARNGSQLPRDGDDAAVLNAHVGTPRLRPGAVVNHGIL